MAHVDTTSRAFGRRAAQGSSGAQALHVARTLLFSASLAAVLVGCAQNKCPAGSELRGGLCKPKSKQGASAAADAAVDAGAAGAHVASGADKDAGYHAGTAQGTDAAQRHTTGDAGPTHATDAGHTTYAADSGTANTTCDHAYVLVSNACVRDYCVQLSGEDSPCPANATCSAGTTLNKVCTCNTGYVQSGNACVRDHCVRLQGEAPACQADATCSNGTAATPTCICDAGYDLTSGVCNRNACKLLTGAPDPAACGAHQTCAPTTPGEKQCTCVAGYADCDASASNGCEAPLGSDANNCGTCGHACPANASCGGATPICTCDPGYDLSGGVCNLNACKLPTGAPDPAACGANQTCMPTTPGQKQCPCVAGYADCDGNASNGCEVTLAGSDANNCGKCAYACAGGLSCTSGVCADRVKLMAAGNYGTCALDPAGLVLGWGVAPAVYPTSASGSPKPERLSLPLATRISVGVLHACLVKADNSGIKCWGQNNVLQLGSGTATATEQELSAAGVNAIAAGYDATCAVIGRPGQVVCWGTVWNGLMGDGVAHQSGDPNQGFTTSASLAGVSDAVDVGVGYQLACALTAGGSVYCWGRGSSDAGAPATFYTPELVKGNDNSALADAVAISVGYSHACALRSNKQLVCWGSNYRGQLGVSATPVARNRYLVVPLASGALGVAAGANHTCAVVPGGTVYCWGDNESGELGSADPMVLRTSSLPLLIPSFGDVAAVYSGSTATHTCARQHDGNVYCWGFNYNGQLGTNQSNQYFAVPQQIDPSLWP